MTNPATVEEHEPEDHSSATCADQHHDQILVDLASAASARSAVVATDALAPTAAASHGTGRYAPLESDQPTLEDDFDRAALVDRIYQIVTQEQPLGTIGIYGGWGSGKSSIMRQVRHRLEAGWCDQVGQAQPGYFQAPPPHAWAGRRERHFRGTVWFSAWEHQHDVDPAVGMLQEARRMLRPSRLNRWRMKKWFAILRNAVSTAGDTLERMAPRLAAVGAPLTALHRSIEQVNRDLFDVQEDQVRKKEAFTEIVRLLARRNTRHRVIFFVDDLDRCDDTVAQRLLDDIKTYLDQEQCVFVIGVNSARLRAGHNQAVRDEDRLAKIIQYPFYVPMLEKDQYRRYVERSLRQKFLAPVATGKASLDEVQIRSVSELLTDTLAARSTSLREAKRLINVFTVNHQLASRAFEETGLWGLYQPLIVAVLSAVQAFCPAAFEWLSGRSDAQVRTRHLFLGPHHPDEDQPPSEALVELDRTTVLAAARKVGSSLTDETRLSLYLTMWGQTHQSTVRHHSRWTREWRARSDLTLPEVQRWIQGIDNGGFDHEWTGHDLRVIILGDWWWWVLDVRPEQPPLPRRALLICEGLVAIRPYTGNLDKDGNSDVPNYHQWLKSDLGEFPGVLWSESSLRQWLRRDFVQQLPKDVANSIVAVSVQTETRWVDPPERVWLYRTTEDSRTKANANDPTTETVHLLSYEEILGQDAVYQFGRVDVDSSAGGGLSSFWWMRSPGDFPYLALPVLPSSLATPDPNYYGMWAGGHAGVRPAFWINLDS